jgi:diguanylate cyclase (GGDEF)-like protein/PAS domain S-box-containing protein
VRLTVQLVLGDAGPRLNSVRREEDPTSARRTEDELQESQRRLQAVFDHIPAGLSLRSLDGRYLFVNEYVANSFNTTAAALVGTDPSAHLDAATRAMVAEADRAMVQSRVPLVSSIQVPHADGTVHDYHVVRYPVLSPDGSVTALGAFSLDVTDQRRSDRTRDVALAELAEAQALAQIGSWQWKTAPDEATWSAEMYRIFDRDPAAGPATSEAFFAYVHPEDRERLAQGYAQTFGGGPSFVLDYRVVLEDGTERIIHALGREDPDHAGSYMGTVQDVSELRAAERQIRIAEERFRGAFESAPIGMAIADLQGRYQRVNTAFCNLTGYTEEALATLSVERITHPEDRAMDWQALDLLSRGQLSEFDREKRYVRPDGEVIWVSIHATVLRDSEGNPTQLLSQVLDITDRRRLESELRRLADHDQLTGLLNRRGFEAVLNGHMAHVRRYGDRGGLLVLDLDNFKSVNDTLGHAAGDQVIARAGVMLRRRIRESDFAARLGGDEFAVLLVETDPVGARRVAEAMVREAANDLAVPGLADSLRVTASVGICALTREIATSAEALAEADRAMYEAKSAGRNRYSLRGFPEPATT